MPRQITEDLAAEHTPETPVEDADEILFRRQEAMRKNILAALNARAIKVTGKPDVCFSLGWLSGAVVALLEGEPNAMQSLRALAETTPHTGA